MSEEVRVTSSTADSRDTEVRVTSATGGQKGQKLARFDLIPTDALWHLAEHYGKGAEKYEARNWERGYDWSLAYAALLRHLTAWWGGEDVDAETGHSHLDAVMFHAMALRTFVETHPEFDDRPKAEPKLYDLSDAAQVDEWQKTQKLNESTYKGPTFNDCPDIEGRDIGPMCTWCGFSTSGQIHQCACEHGPKLTPKEFKRTWLS